MIEVDNIVGNLIPNEAARITKVKKLGDNYSVHYLGLNTQGVGSKILTPKQISELEVLANDGEFNFRGDPEKFVLFAEAERIKSAYQFDPLFAINCSVVDPLPHQVEAVYKFLLPQPRIRFLLADDTGAGKTIMTGLLIKELMMRHTIERVLIVTPGGLTKQWQEDEMGVKFNIPFTLVNRAAFSGNPTIFQTEDHVVTSIDFLSQEDILKVVSNTTWDLVVFDEAHKLSAYEYGQKTYRSRRYEAASQLSKQTEHLLLLTATPHRGRTDTFKRLLQILDEDIFATPDLAADRVKELSKEGLNKFFIRRLKEDMRDWDNNPLYKPRYTTTVSYQLTVEEKKLYDAVTQYLSQQKKEAADSKNIYVSLALAVMQRRLVSSIFAIKNTLERRWQTLQGVVAEISANPELWKKRQKFEDTECTDIDQYDDLDDQEREALDKILSDPKKFKLFTTGKSLQEIREEAEKVKELFDMASALYNSHVEEKKYEELKQLLQSEGVINGEKLVIFTEHKDTLLYLQERLTNTGYHVNIIHGGMNVDERRQSQIDFMKPDSQILIATDAAGEGINLQFCRLLINWDIPWNPNRLEQRMGRVHRYGQQKDVLVFNMVAENTREGAVLKRLLEKLDTIRQGLGDDRVYDVIQDVLKGVALDDIIKSVLDGKESEFDKFIGQNETTLQNLFKDKINSQKKSLEHSEVDFVDARRLKENSDERRLQPIYVRLFFERAFKHLGGKYTELGNGIFSIASLPKQLAERLKSEYHKIPEAFIGAKFCFDKDIFMNYQNSVPEFGTVHYINPGNMLFDALVDSVRDEFREEMLKGTVLVSPEDTDNQIAYFVKCQISDNRPHRGGGGNVACEQLAIVIQHNDGSMSVTSPAKLLDTVPPSTLAKDVELPDTISNEKALEWAYENITMPLFEQTRKKVDEDAEAREQYIRTAFTQIIMDLDLKINEMQGRLFFGSVKDDEKLRAMTEVKRSHERRREERIEQLAFMTQLSPSEPEILGCAYLVALNNMEYHSHFHMSRDSEVESIAMSVAAEHETANGRTPVDVSADNVGYDLRSESPDGTKRYIEVKGRAGTDGVMLSENEWNRLAQLGKKAWLYIVTECGSNPTLNIINDPANSMKFEMCYKGIQYYLSLEEWREKVLPTN